MRRTLTALCTLLVALALPSFAHAQGMVFSDPSFDADERACIRMTLGLNEQQNELFEELLEGYNDEFMALSAGFAEMQENDVISEQDDIEAALEKLAEISARADEIQTRLFEDLELVLTPEQARAIDACRDRLKRMGVTNSEVSQMFEQGVSLGHDPVGVALDLGLPGRLDDERRDAFERAMRSYDRALDRRVDDLQEAILEMLKGVTDMSEDPMGAMARIEKLFGDLFEAANAYREDHQDKGLAIARTLPDTLASSWTRTFMEGLYPGPYARTACETVMDRLLLLPDLDADTFAGVIEVQDGYNKSASALRKEWADELDDEMRDAEFSLLSMGLSDTEGIDAPYRERLEKLEAATIDKLRRAAGRDRVDAMHTALQTEREEADDEAPSSGGIEIRTTTDG